jgi:hypothetical protein
VFTERMVVKLRADQHDAVQRIARTLGMTASDVMRWWIDEGVRAVEGVPEYMNLSEELSSHARPPAESATERESRCSETRE